jgi:hypothetical protein
VRWFISLLKKFSIRSETRFVSLAQAKTKDHQFYRFSLLPQLSYRFIFAENQKIKHKYRLIHGTQACDHLLHTRVRRSFSVEAKRCENLANFFFFSLRSEKQEIRRETKANEAKTTKRNETEPKNWENKSQKGQNLIDIQVLIHPPPHHRMHCLV